MRFYQIAKIKNPNIEVHFSLQQNINEMNDTTDILWDGIVSVPQTKSMHCVIPIKKFVIKVGQVSDASPDSFNIFHLKKDLETH